MINPVVWLWEDNAGGLYIGRDKGPWYQVDGEPGKFDDDAWGYASTDDMDFEYSAAAGKLDSEPQAALVAKWEEGTISILGTSLAGSMEPGIAAKRYMQA